MSSALNQALAALGRLDDPQRCVRSPLEAAIIKALEALAIEHQALGAIVERQDHRLITLETWSSAQTVTDDPAATLAPRPAEQRPCMAETLRTASNVGCPARESTHCQHWWSNVGECCACRAPSDVNLEDHLRAYAEQQRERDDLRAQLAQVRAALNIGSGEDVVEATKALRQMMEDATEDDRAAREVLEKLRAMVAPGEEETLVQCVAELVRERGALKQQLAEAQGKVGRAREALK